MKLYTHNTGELRGRKYLAIKTPDGKRTTKLYSRYLMEEHTGRTLERHEHVDHIDGDPTNDDLSNLQVLTASEHKKKTAEQLGWAIEMYIGSCPCCGEEFSKPAKDVKANREKGKAGPYCSRRCAGRTHYKHRS